jgi:hypothetical protein
MRYIIILAILALAYSGPSFLRNLQETPAPETTTDSALQQTFTEANFSMAGDWTMHSSNCTSTCIPTISFSEINVQSTQVMLTLNFPTDPSCGNLSGQAVQLNETYKNGVWSDNDTNSILYEAFGIYFMNNMTEWTWQRDVANPELFCWISWTSASSMNTTETVPTEKTWEGAWKVVSSIPSDGSTCCLTDIPALIIEDLATQTVSVTWRTSDCDACGDFKNTVVSSNMSVIGGAGYFTSPFTNAHLFLVNGSVVYTDPLCAVEYQKVPTTSCAIPEGNP